MDLAIFLTRENIFLIGTLIYGKELSFLYSPL